MVQFTSKRETEVAPEGFFPMMLLHYLITESLVQGCMIVSTGQRVPCMYSLNVGLLHLQKCVLC